MHGFKRVLWWLIAGSHGGINRGRILTELFKKACNANELAKKLQLDYKTVRHHLKVLEKNRLITHLGVDYGKMYFPSDLLEKNKIYFDEIWSKIGKNQK